MLLQPRSLNRFLPCQCNEEEERRRKRREEEEEPRRRRAARGESHVRQSSEQPLERLPLTCRAPSARSACSGTARAQGRGAAHRPAQRHALVHRPLGLCLARGGGAGAANERRRRHAAAARSGAGAASWTSSSRSLSGSSSSSNAFSSSWCLVVVVVVVLLLLRPLTPLLFYGLGPSDGV